MRAVASISTLAGGHVPFEFGINNPRDQQITPYVQTFQTYSGRCRRWRWGRRSSGDDLLFLVSELTGI
ncbi:unnamed protein product [Cuscuta campestris]|uniref:Uncharacterized protein n=1 Tax=Cuscuta campestris TaxID=132261 RepID=A0A484K6S2_9ASTE|nr:unnamed protein product [Cuscuta campestris]